MITTGMYLPDITFILPEAFLVIIAFLLLIEGVMRTDLEPYHIKRFGNLAVLSLLIACVLFILLHKPGERWVAFGGHLIQDDFIYLAQLMILIGSAAVLGISLLTMMREQLLSFEYFALILFATVGMLFMVSANDLLSLFVSLEVQGLSLYILVALDREQEMTSEAALKYFVLGAFATCLYLYGATLLYGFSGTTNFDVLTAIIRAVPSESFPLGLVTGIVFVVASLSFKISLVPFHMWTPDVYQGCPTPITAFIATTPKIAALLVLLRLLVSPFGALYAEWQSLLVILSAVSMVLGAFGALGQNNIKRLLAYSTICQMGYALMGVAAGNGEGIQAVFLYLALYLVMTVGAFGCLLCLRGKGTHNVQTLEDLSGLASLHPRISFCLALFLFSLAGIPPLAGFFAKFTILKAAFSVGFFKLALLGSLTSTVSAYYYLKIVKGMYFDAIPASPPFSYGQTVTLSFTMGVILKFCAIIVLLFFVWPNPLLELIHHASLIMPA